MKADAMAARMSMLSRAVPMRLLVVDDDEAELTGIADRLSKAGLEIVRALNGQEALAILEKQWFPVIITDWEMPLLDGIQLTERLRARGVDDTYVIMLTARDGTEDYERGYAAGVDDYLTKKTPEAELLARVHAGFNTLALRRSLREACSALESSSTLDPATGACNTRHFFERLNSEIKRAERYQRTLSLMTLSVQPPATEGSTAEVPRALLPTLVQQVQSVIRMHVDWIGRLESDRGTVTFGIVLPEAGPAAAAAVKQRIQATLRPYTHGPEAHLMLSFGFSSLESKAPNRRGSEPNDLVQVAEQCRKCAAAHGSSQLSAVQLSVAHGVAIACRHGYAIESHCEFKAVMLGPRKNDKAGSAVKSAQ